MVHGTSDGGLELHQGIDEVMSIGEKMNSGYLEKMRVAIFTCAALLALDDTIDNFFPEFEYGKGITVYQLLHMQSGLRKDFVTEETFLSENGERNYEEWKRYFYDGFTDDELLNMVFDDELLFKPGTQYLYSNAGYSLLAMIIEKTTGQSYGDYVQKNIFDT